MKSISDWYEFVQAGGVNIGDTKGDIMFNALRPNESAKFECGIKHFKALGNDVMFEKADGFANFMEKDR